MICIKSEIGVISFPDFATELSGRPRELVSYCVYQQGRLVYREAHPLDEYSIRLDVTLERGVSKKEAEQHIKVAVARYVKEFAFKNLDLGLNEFTSTLDHWGLQSLIEDKESIPGPAVQSQAFDPMIGYSAFTRGLVMTGRQEHLMRSELESVDVSLFRYEPLPESEDNADFLGHLYFGRHPGALMVEDALLSEGHWVLPYLSNLQDIQLELGGGRRAKAKAPEILARCRIFLCDSFSLLKHDDKTLTITDFPLRTRIQGRDALLLTPQQSGDAESIALQFLSVDDLDAEDLQCFNDTVGVIDEWLARVRKADKLFTIIK